MQNGIFMVSLTFSQISAVCQCIWKLYVHVLAAFLHIENTFQGPFLCVSWEHMIVYAQEVKFAFKLTKYLSKYVMPICIRWDNCWQKRGKMIAAAFPWLFHITRERWEAKIALITQYSRVQLQQQSWSMFHVPGNWKHLGLVSDTRSLIVLTSKGFGLQ